MDSIIKFSPVIPPDPELLGSMVHYVSYSSGISDGVQPFEYSGWRDECTAWHETCYIHSNLWPSPIYRFSGPDSIKFMKKYFANTFENFPVGKAKHGIMCDEEGRDMVDGLLLKIGENKYETFWLAPWVQYCVETSGMEIKGELLTGKIHLFQLGGPKSLEIVEAACGENLHDIKFIHHRMSNIAGKDVRVLRVGMAGSLAYEVHCKVEDAIPVYERLIKAGKKYGLRRQGLPSYNMTHWENGFPQAYLDFPLPWYENKAFGAWLDQHLVTRPNGTDPNDTRSLRGSMGKDMRLRYRNPIELGWGKTINFDHDFIGKEALQRIAADPSHRIMVTLEWDKEDIMDIHRSQYDQEPYKDISDADDLSFNRPGLPADQVLNSSGECIGISTGRMFSWYYRNMISICSIDPQYSAEGSEVFVLWGEPGTRQKKIRAKITRYPYFNTGRNQSVDVNKIPVGTMD